MQKHEEEMQTKAHTLIEELAKKAKVAPEDVKKVVDQLGMDPLMAELRRSVRDEQITKLSIGELKIAARLGQSSVIV